MSVGASDRTLADALGPLATCAGDSFGTPVFTLAPADLLPVVQQLKDAFGFDLFLDVTAIDHAAARTPRFDVVWHFRSSRPPVRRVRLKAAASEHAPHVPSLTGLYGAARYMEREAHDMYGIVFDGNADLRPILLYEGFVGHPLRKDYPMEQEQPIVEYRK